MLKKITISHLFNPTLLHCRHTGDPVDMTYIHMTATTNHRSDACMYSTRLLRPVMPLLYGAKTPGYCCIDPAWLSV